MGQLKGLKIAILVADGFQQSEMTEPKKALEAAGAEALIISPVEGKVKGWLDKDWKDEFPVDENVSEADPEDFDALLLPGGIINPDTLRINPGAMDFIKSFVRAHKPIAAICHGPSLLIDTGVVKGKQMTSWPSIKGDLVNAGAKWINEEVVVDGNLITSRNPEDIPAFCKAMIDLLGHIGA